MKHRANLFKRNILNTSDAQSIDFVENIHHALVNISENELQIEFSNGEIQNLRIEFLEKDNFTSTHLVQFKNGNKFRLIQPVGVSLEMAMLNQDSQGGFSIGSMDTRGWAIYFFLTAPDDFRNSYKKESEKSIELEALMSDLLRAFDNGQQNKFLEVGKRILDIIQSDPMQIYFYADGSELAYKLKANAKMFNTQEQKVIGKIDLR